MLHAPPSVVLSLSATLLTSGAAWGAQMPSTSAADFDPGRAILSDEPMFDPFRPEALERLDAALEDGRVTDETAVLVLERDGRHLALLTMQMSYHHVAQGEMDGEPWMVSF